MNNDYNEISKAVSTFVDQVDKLNACNERMRIACELARASTDRFAKTIKELSKESPPPKPAPSRPLRHIDI